MSAREFLQLSKNKVLNKVPLLPNQSKRVTHTANQTRISFLCACYYPAGRFPRFSPISFRYFFSKDFYNLPRIMKQELLFSSNHKAYYPDPSTPRREIFGFVFEEILARKSHD